MPKKSIKYSAILRHERELRNWSQQELIKRILDRCAKDDEYPALNIKTVSRWERGKCKPSPYYRGLLCQTFGLNAIQMGFIEGDRP